MDPKVTRYKSGQIKTATYPNGLKQGWDENGNLTLLVMGNITEKWEFDSKGRIVWFEKITKGNVTGKVISREMKSWIWPAR